MIDGWDNHNQVDKTYLNTDVSVSVRKFDRTRIIDGNVENEAVDVAYYCNNESNLNILSGCRIS